MNSLHKYFGGNRIRVRALHKSPILNGTIVGSAVVLLFVALQDYREFKALGPGGTPYNVFGWLFVTLVLRPLSLSRNGTTRYDDYDMKDGPVSEGLLDLPKREGHKPLVMGIAPQRQMSQQAPESMRKVCSYLVCETD
jgi:hypothetical protein